MVYVVIIVSMGKRRVFTDKQIKKIRLLRLQNLSYQKISSRLDVSQHIVRKYCSDIKPVKKEVVATKEIVKRGKYDHLFEEPICQGRNYNEY